MSRKNGGKRSLWLLKELTGSPLFGSNPSQLLTSTPIPKEEEDPKKTGPKWVASAGTCMGMKLVSSGFFLQDMVPQLIS